MMFILHENDIYNEVEKNGIYYDELCTTDPYYLDTFSCYYFCSN